MPDNKEYYDLLYAYTLGCLDNEELEKIKEQIKTGENFPWLELGEFQNLSSLLPSILSIESPAKEVKDKVARKLYRIRQEIKAKRDTRKGIRKNNEKENITGQEPEKIIEEPSLEEEIEQDLKDKFKPDIEEFEIVSPRPEANYKHLSDKKEKEPVAIEKSSEAESGDEIVLDFGEDPAIISEDEIDTISMTGEEQSVSTKTTEEIEAEKHAEEKRLKKKRRYTSSLEKNKEEKKKSGLSLVLAFIAFFIIIVSVVFLYYKSSVSVKKYESEINTLNNEIVTLSDQLKQNREQQVILNSKNLITVDMESANATASTFGKLFISTDLNKGYLQLTNLSTLPGNGVYQLWINFSGKYLSLLKFNPAENTSYFPVEIPQINAKTKANFIITSEPEGGSEQPGKDVILGGHIK